VISLKPQTLDTIGTALAISGSALSIIGTLINNCALDHIGAMWCWLISNPLLLVWAIGNWKGIWNGGTSITALIVMYFVFFVTGAYGLFVA
jgi:hypothetical protein